MKTFLQFVLEAKIIEPETPTEDIREHYIAGEIFKEGSLIEQVSTGRTGTVMRRGTNYLICLTDNGELFKPWITDSKEVE
jgi:hypothetical protein